MNTGRRWSWLRTRSRKEEGEGRKEATNIKSNNPHLAGGEKPLETLTVSLSRQICSTKLRDSIIKLCSLVDRHRDFKRMDGFPGVPKSSYVWCTKSQFKLLVFLQVSRLICVLIFHADQSHFKLW